METDSKIEIKFGLWQRLVIRCDLEGVKDRRTRRALGTRDKNILASATNN